ncbi:hypothetical protein Tco_1570235 [Tanacetum coccineum]
MVSPRTIREVQSLNRKQAALGRFLARSAKKALPFFKTLKGCIEKRDFRWSQEAEEAFQKLKLHLQSLPALTVSILGETLTLYLAVSHETVSSVLMVESENIQQPVYFAGVVVDCMGLEVGCTILTGGALMFYLWFPMLCSLLCLAESWVSTCREVIRDRGWAVILADTV